MVVLGASSPLASWSPVLTDAAFLVVDKDAGLLTVPGIGPDKADCLLSRLRAEGFPEITYAPHRLDRDTSGLVAIGRSAAAHRSLSIQFQERRVAKRYEALVSGWLEEDEGEIDAPIAKARLPGESFARMQIAALDGRPCTTRWKLVERVDGARSEGVRCSLVELLPITGRAHQLRLHMRHIGHPILGDELHGDAEAKEAVLKLVGGKQRVLREPRLCLHASRLTFRHPSTDDPVQVQSQMRPWALGEA